jgi:hypothetical protein
VRIDSEAILAAAIGTGADKFVADLLQPAQHAILRADGNGFVLLTDEGEQSFFPAKIGTGSKLETDESMKDVVNGLLNDLAYCRPSQSGLYQRVALHEGRETPIPEIPIIAKRGRPA